MWWTPAFLQRSHHLSVGQAGQLLGPMHLIAGTASTLLAGWLMAQRAAADPRYVTRLLGWVTALTTVPSMLLYWVVSERAAVLLLWVFVPAVYFYIGPILGLLQNVVPAHMRATASAMFLFINNLIGLGLGTFVIGTISDALKGQYGDEALRPVRHHPNFELIVGDCRNIQDVVKSMQSVDSVIHLAALRLPERLLILDNEEHAWPVARAVRSAKPR